MKQKEYAAVRLTKPKNSLVSHKDPNDGIYRNVDKLRDFENIPKQGRCLKSLLNHRNSILFSKSVRKEEILMQNL